MCVSWTSGIPALSVLSWKLIKQLHVVLVCVCVCVSWTNGIPALSVLSWKLIKQLHVVLVCVCVCPGQMVFQHLVF